MRKVKHKDKKGKRKIKDESIYLDMATRERAKERESAHLVQGLLNHFIIQVLLDAHCRHMINKINGEDFIKRKQIERADR